MAMDSPHNGSSWGGDVGERGGWGGRRGRGTGRGASRCYVTLRAIASLRQAAPLLEFEYLLTCATCVVPHLFCA